MNGLKTGKWGTQRIIAKSEIARLDGAQLSRRKSRLLTEQLAQACQNLALIVNQGTHQVAISQNEYMADGDLVLQTELSIDTPEGQET